MGCGAGVQRLDVDDDAPTRKCSTPTQCSLVVERPGRIYDAYDVGTKEIGKGAYGSVFRAVDKQSTLARAVKKVVKIDDKETKKVRKEISMMKLVDHPNIIKLYEIWEDPYYLYLVMELCTGGELLERIVKDGNFKERDTAIIMHQVFHAVHYMHKQGICHRDLKAENCMLRDAGPIGESDLKIVDFGFATRVGPGRVLKTRAGTITYVAPEVFSGYYTELCDLWSCGVVCFLLLSGTVPFTGASEKEIMTKIKKAVVEFGQPAWPSVSEDAKELIRSLLIKHPHQRLTSQTALQAVWIKEKAPRSAPEPLPQCMVDNLRCYQSSNRLRQAALQCVASHTREEQVRKLRSIFSQMDRDHDGLLTLREMRDSLSHAEGMEQANQLLQPFMEELAAARRLVSDEEVHAEDRPFLNYTEFLASTLSAQVYHKEDLLMTAFRHFDINGDGFISIDELRQLLGKEDVVEIVGANTVETVMTEVDASGDGRIDFPEFLALMRPGQVVGYTSTDSRNPSDAITAAPCSEGS